MARVPVRSSGWMMGLLLGQEMLAKPRFGGRSPVLIWNVEFEVHLRLCGTRGRCQVGI